jgi:hypothetical protein
MNLGLLGLPSIARSYRPALKTQSPEQGGGCRCLPNLLDRHWFSLPQLRSCPAKPNPLVCGVFPPSPGRLPPRSVPISHCAAARTLLHSPRGSVVRRPASGPPLPPLSSSHSSRHARRAAVHTVVTPCPDRTAPRCTARSPAPPDCGAESDTTTADRPAPIMPTCSHRCDHSCAYDASTPPLTAGLPPTPRAHHLCDHVLHPGRVSSHFDDYPRRRGGPRTSVQFTRGMVKGGCLC